MNEILDDLCSRFIINIPAEELQSLERICFHLEAAHWFYEDFYREQNKKLTSYSLKDFARLMFWHCPLLKPHMTNNSFDQIFESFTHYKVRVPVCGGVILNGNMDKVLLVKGWSSKATWGFPKGKINKDEREIDCAIREVLEETSFDISDYVNEEDCITVTMKEQRTKLYIVHSISEDIKFAPKTRKEISKIDWIPLALLPTSHNVVRDGQTTPMKNPNNYWMVIPFVNKIKKWVQMKKKQLESKKKTPIILRHKEPEPESLPLLEKLSTAFADFESQKNQKPVQRMLVFPDPPIVNRPPIHPPPNQPLPMPNLSLPNQMFPLPNHPVVVHTRPNFAEAEPISQKKTNNPLLAFKFDRGPIMKCFESLQTTA
eukprot:TRINITY_DN11487_c0_g1_i1.p1 TRINITY_DN11487_c0_g1~~TRINITY_DN11487_c0_g1_i1.p1  ORF type:complete len:393 (-),score=92.59 TRINITY_DN11487_c0_g1_i1:20-1135(-)